MALNYEQDDSHKHLVSISWSLTFWEDNFVKQGRGAM